MKQFFLALALGILTVIIIAGGRGGFSRRTPIEIFPDMDHQPRFKPQDPGAFFADGRASRAEIPGTVPRGFNKLADAATEYRMTGRQGANWGDGIPVDVTPALLELGREKFTINCAVCHGAAGQGNGFTTKFGMAAVANLHDPRIVGMADGEIFNTITWGKGTMMGYGNQVTPDERWAVICYIRALQRSQNVAAKDLPEELRKQLK
jgi:mono/diheme cytochrome c family protein